MVLQQVAHRGIIPEGAGGAKMYLIPEFRK
jgi:hypothetical protein